MSKRSDLPDSLPENWRWATFGDVAEYINGYGFSKSEWEDEGRPIIRIQNLTGTGDSFNYYSGEIDEKYVVTPGTLLISWSATLGAYIWRGQEALLNQHIYKVKPHGHVSKKYLYYVADFSDDELFSNLDAGMADLQTADRQLGRYRLSVLQAAIEGRLTADWRRTHDPEPADQLLERILEERRNGWEKRYRTVRYDAKGKEPPSGWKDRYDEPEPLDLGEEEVWGIPDNWTWANLDELKIFSRYGPRFSSDDYEGKGHYVLRTTDISDFGSVDTESAPQIPLSKVDRAKYQLQRGDLLITRTGSIGTLAVFDDEIEAIAGAYLIQYRLVGSEVLPWYIFNFLKSPFGQRRLTQGSGGTGRPNLNAPTIQSIPIPLPPIQEQKEILQEIERLLSVADDAAATAEREHTRADRLRQSILKQAFSGRLVPHDENAAPPSIDREGSNHSGSDASDGSESDVEDLLGNTDPSKQIEMDL